MTKLQNIDRHIEWHEKLLLRSYDAKLPHEKTETEYENRLIGTLQDLWRIRLEL